MTFEAPPDWELGAYGGTREAGYACLDDGLQMRLRVRWHQTTSKRTDLEDTLRRYGHSLRRSATSAAVLKRLDTDLAPKHFLQNKDVVCCRWETDITALGVLWHCHECLRSVVLEMMFPRTERMAAAQNDCMRRLLASAADHPQGGEVLWSVYGFAFRAPATYNLERPDLRPGRLEFPLRASRRAWMKVERWARAQSWLERAAWDAWPRERLKLEHIYRVADIDQEQERIHGHAGCSFKARCVRKGLMGVLSPGFELEGVAWHCPAGDKIFAVMGVGAKAGVIERIVETIRCG